jgi:hypothetical protein
MSAKKQYEDKTISKMDKSQIENKPSSMDAKAELDDSPSDLTIKGIDFCCDKPIDINAEPVVLDSRFNKSHKIDIKKE